MTMERYYEVLLLTVPETTEDELKGIEKHLEDIIQKDKGSLVSFEKWGKYRLAYPVKKNSYGVYTLARFKTPSATTTAEQIKTILAIKFDSLVMRSVITLLGDSATEYTRPRSLEETPMEDVGGMMKDYRRDKFGRGRSDRPSRFAPREQDVAELNDDQIDADIDVDTEDEG